jgi:hypothetical protein
MKILRMGDGSREGIAVVLGFKQTSMIGSSLRMLKQVLELLSLPLGAEGSVEHPATHRLLSLMMEPLSLFVGLLSGIALYKSAWPSGISLLIGTALVAIIAFQPWRKNIRNAEQSRTSAYWISKLIYITVFILGVSAALFLIAH